jgi:serine/threonine-protein kinase
MIGRSIGRYEVRAEIGQGGMASVYLADDPRFRRQVAVKVLPVKFLENPHLRQRFEREARLIATIEHPAIVPVYDFGEQDGQLYLVMRYMSGGSLSTRIRRGPLPLGFAVKILSQLAPALDAVNAQGIIHRDLKPGNILFDGYENPALADFGIAHLSEATVQLTGAAIIGTPAYMSPEQVRGEADLDGRSDVYSLGVILFEMLAGRQPFSASTPMQTALCHLAEPVPEICPLLPGLPLELDRILARAMAKDREERYPTAAELASDLRALPELASPHQERERRLPGTAPLAETETEVDVPPSPESLLSAESDLPEQPVRLPTAAEKTAPQLTARKPVHRTGVFALGLAGLLGAAGLCLLLLLSGLFLWNAQRQQAGQGPGSQGQAAAQTPTGASQENEAVTPGAGGEPLFTDDFSRPANGWPVGSTAGGGYQYAGGSYQIQVSQEGALFWAAPDGSYADAAIAVMASNLRDTEGGYYGLFCRLQDNANFYYLVIRTDGHYTIGKYKDSEFLSLLPEGWRPSPAILTGRASNRLRAECEGDRLSLYVNDEWMAEARDADFSEGKAGLLAAALRAGGIEVNFDNFSISP